MSEANFLYTNENDTISPFPDVNECLPDSPCHANAKCNNKEGSYICTCDSGHSGDGLSCDSTNRTAIVIIVALTITASYI